MGIFADLIEEVRKMPPAGKVLVLGAAGAAVLVIVARNRSASGASGGTTAAGSTDNGTFGIVPGVNPGDATTSGAPGGSIITPKDANPGAGKGLSNLFKLGVNSSGQETVTTPGGYTLAQIAALFGDKANAEYYSGANARVRDEIQKANPKGGATKYNNVVLRAGDVITLSPNALGATMSN